MPRRESLKILFFVLFLGFFAGCATTEEYKPMPTPPTERGCLLPKKKGYITRSSVGRRFGKLPKAYGVSIKDIIDSNNIPNGSAIEVGQLLFIPGVKEVKDISDAHRG